jgi:hypothetical protein
MSPELQAHNNHPTKQETKGYPKFIIFNVGDTTAREFYTIIKIGLGENWFKCITKVSRVTSLRSPPRMLISVMPHLAEMFRRQLLDPSTESYPGI